MTTSRAHRAALGAALLLAGCQVVLGIEERDAIDPATPAGAGGAAGAAGVSGQAGQAGEGGAAGAAAGGSGSSGQAGEATCRGVSAERGSLGREMVRLQGPTAGECLLIDRHEVSRGDYDAFLASGPDASQQPSGCTQNAFARAAGCDDLGGRPAGDEAAPRLPVACVDQCDAAAFCRWDGGKRLCGAVAPVTALPNSEWYLACSSESTHALPYPGDYQAAVCNDSEAVAMASCGGCTTAPVGAFSGCVTDQGALDLAGNVAEWTADCAGEGASAGCTVRGGSFFDSAKSLSCSTARSVPRDQASADIGFRCCTDG